MSRGSALGRATGSGTANTPPAATSTAFNGDTLIGPAASPITVRAARGFINGLIWLFQRSPTADTLTYSVSFAASRRCIGVSRDGLTVSWARPNGGSTLPQPRSSTDPYLRRPATGMGGTSPAAWFLPSWRSPRSPEPCALPRAPPPEPPWATRWPEPPTTAGDADPHAARAMRRTRDCLRHRLVHWPDQRQAGRYAGLRYGRQLPGYGNLVRVKWSPSSTAAKWNTRSMGIRRAI